MLFRSAYIDRIDHAELADVRSALAHRVRRPVTFGWGPRFLHSTGQFHKGGPKVGRFLQLLHDGPRDVSIPGRGYTFGTLKEETATYIIVDTGTPKRILKSDIAKRANGPSAMPPMGARLTRRELRDVVEYLSSLR